MSKQPESLVLEPELADQNYDLNEFKTIDCFLEAYPQFTKSQIRWWLYERERNGFESVVSKVGRRIYLHVPSFYTWFKSQKGENRTSSTGIG